MDSSWERDWDQTRDRSTRPPTFQKDGRWHEALGRAEKAASREQNRGGVHDAVDLDWGGPVRLPARISNRGGNRLGEKAEGRLLEKEHGAEGEKGHIQDLSFQRLGKDRVKLSRALLVLPPRAS